jgi:hypothetical protein
MADATNNKVDMSAIAFDLAKEKGFGSDEAKFKDWEKSTIKKIYEIIGLSDIPDEFLTFSKFIDAYSGVLVKSVQSDIAIMNLTKRLAMFRLSEGIQATADKPAPEAAAASSEGGEKKPTGFDPLAK